MSPLPHTKHREFFFGKKLCMGEQTFCGKFMGEYFTWGLSIRSCKGGGGKLLVKRFLWSSQATLPLIDTDLGILIYYLKS